jgi:hypothetical protein
MRSLMSLDVVDFYYFMLGRFGAGVHDRANSNNMRAASWILDTLGIIDKSVFMNRFTTTIGTTIYTPFTPGTKDRNYSFWDQMTILVHECEHVVQSKKNGFLTFATEYLTSDSHRAHYEAEAYRCDLEMHFWRYGKILDTNFLANKLKNYALGEKDIEYVKLYLDASVDTIQVGGIIGEASQVAITWLNEKASWLKDE